MRKRRVLSALEIQAQRPVVLTTKLLNPADRTLPKPRGERFNTRPIHDERVARKLEATRQFGGLVPDREGVQWWKCPGCDRLYKDGNSAWFCCRIGRQRVNVCRSCHQEFADCHCPPMSYA